MRALGHRAQVTHGRPGRQVTAETKSNNKTKCKGKTEEKPEVTEAKNQREPQGL